MPRAIIPPSADGAATPETPPSAGGELTGSQVALTAAGVAKGVVHGLGAESDAESLDISHPEPSATSPAVETSVADDSEVTTSPDYGAPATATDLAKAPEEVAPVTPWMPADGTTLTSSVPPVGGALGSTVPTPTTENTPTTTTNPLPTPTTENITTTTSPTSAEVTQPFPQFGNRGVVPSPPPEAR